MDAHQRRQVTLFVPEPIRSQIESIRKQYNPAQFGLIAAHVTLCRDDEVSNWLGIQARARQLKSVDILLTFGAPRRDKNLVYLPVIRNSDSFDELRQFILHDTHCRNQLPHITLVHPRNGTCTVAEFDAIRESIGEVTISFDRLTFIEKVGDLPWASLCSFTTSTNLPYNIDAAI